MTIRHFITTQDYSRAEIDALLVQAAEFKRSPRGQQLAGKSVALLFFNPSMRTRTSFELGAFHLGGHAIVLAPGKDAWPIEFEVGSVMDGDTEEHIAEVARVLSRYVDLICVRAFPKFQDWAVDRQDKVIKAFAQYATVPVINMETITHPCQELAHAMAMKEHLGDLQNRKYVLTWTYHPKPLNTAVANSALLIATKLGDPVADPHGDPIPNRLWVGGHQQLRPIRAGNLATGLEPPSCVESQACSGSDTEAVPRDHAEHHGAS